MENTQSLSWSRRAERLKQPVRGNRLSRLRAKNYHGPEEEWEEILALILLRKSPQGQDATSVQGLEVFASITEDELAITIRKNIGGITVSYGIRIFFGIR